MLLLLIVMVGCFIVWGVMSRCWCSCVVFGVWLRMLRLLFMLVKCCGCLVVRMRFVSFLMKFVSWILIIVFCSV